MIYENRHEIQFTCCWASSEARSLSSVRAEQSGVATWDYLLTIGLINQLQLQWPKRSRTYSIKVRDTVSNIFTYWTCLASSFVLTDHLVCRVKGRKVDLGEIYWAKLNSKASYTSTLVTNNLELKAKHLKFVLVPAVNQHLLKSLPPLDFMRKIGGSCLMMMRD